MAAVLYRCPITRQHVSGWIADDPDSDEDRLATISCLACQRVHLVSPKTGKVIGGDDD